MKVIIVIPTYNERENIGQLINALQNEFKKVLHDISILVVDDNSPDGTADIVKRESKKYSNVHLITGEKKGLGAAYIRGFNHAINALMAHVIMEMDGDFSHKPEDVSRMISTLDEGADFVIGSRYVNGGRIPENWPFIRKMISKWGNIFARYIAGLYKIRDCTAGFRAIRVSVLKKIDLTNFRVQGYAFQVALLNQAILNKAKVKEIPVEFVDRIRGETKLGFSDIVEFMINAWWIRLENSKTFIKFTIIGASGVFVNLGTFTVLIRSGLNKFIASPISIEFSIISNFLLNYHWTFTSRNSKNKLNLEGLRFNIVSFIALGLNYLTFILLSLLFPDVMPQIHQAIGLIPASLVNYLFNSYWTFRENPII